MMMHLMFLLYQSKCIYHLFYLDDNLQIHVSADQLFNFQTLNQKKGNGYDTGSCTIEYNCVFDFKY